MSESDTALLVIDVQESFRIYSDADVPVFVERLQKLVDGAKARNIPVVQIFHVSDSGPFSIDSGLVRTFSQVTGCSRMPCSTSASTAPSSAAGSMSGWSRTEFAASSSPVSRPSSAARRRRVTPPTCGYAVDFVSEATLTFAMKDAQGT